MTNTQEPASQGLVSAKEGELSRVALRRHGDADQRYDLGSTAEEVLAAFDRALNEGKSEAILLWPQPIQGLSVIHALAALSKLSNCDTRRLATLFFPWNRNSGAAQKALLVDREQLIRVALGPLNRIYAEGAQHPAFGYLMALHSLKHLSKGEQGNRRYKALEQDPSLLHPTLFEIIPQAGIHASEFRLYEDQFLRRLRHHTWISERSEHIGSASDPATTPFFLIGIHPDASSVELLRKARLDPEHGGRRPDIVLIDLTRRARNALGEHWRDAIAEFCRTILELYGKVCPPALVITDEVFAAQTVRWKVLNEYDAARGATTSPQPPAQTRLIINIRADILDAMNMAPAWLDELSPEVYGNDLLNFVDAGLRLRRSLLNGGESEIASVVEAAIAAVQNLMGLPGPVRQFREFLVSQHEGYELHRLGDRFDHLAPRGKIATAIKLGSAGVNHTQLEAFLKTYNELCAGVAADNPGTRFFDACLSRLAQESSRSLVVFSSDVIRAFAEWRIQSEMSLESMRPYVGKKILFARNREVPEELERAHAAQTPYGHILFIEPYADDFLKVLAEPALPRRATILCHLARAKQVLERANALLQLDGAAPIEWNLLMVQERFQKAMIGHTIDIPDLDAFLLEPRVSTLDLAGPRTASSGPTRIIRTSGHVRIRAFDGTELAVYDPDGLPMFSKRLAKDLKPGDQVCVFTPDFVDTVRDKLRLNATAPEVLALYHRAVVDATARLPGEDLTARADALRKLILKADPSLALTLPGPQSIRQWIDVADLLKTPRDEVRPQAPRDRDHYFAFMKALGVADDVARNYWDLGIFWTRSMRISTGSAFHQVFMGVLIDPYGTISRFPEENRQDVWRIHETAEDHLVAVVSNDPEG
jgi:hypothetical protein